jgi:hypothetical protein
MRHEVLDPSGWGRDPELGDPGVGHQPTRTEQNRGWRCSRMGEAIASAMNMLKRFLRYLVLGSPRPATRPRYDLFNGITALQNAVASVYSLQYLLYEMLSFLADDGDDLEAGGAPSGAQTINRRNHSTVREIGKEWCKQVTDAILVSQGLSRLIYAAVITFWTTALFQRCKYY